MLTGVLDSSATIGLSKGGVLDRLSVLYSPLYIPSAVRQEVIGQGGGRAGAAELANALGSWITEVTPNPTTLQQFAALRSQADREVLATALDQQVDHVL